MRTLDAVAKEMGGTPTQVVLAWLMAQPSATSLEQLEDLLRATELRLPATALEKLAQVSRPAVSA